MFKKRHGVCSGQDWAIIEVEVTAAEFLEEWSWHGDHLLLIPLLLRK
jgi:hypothetical protein